MKLVRDLKAYMMWALGTVRWARGQHSDWMDGWMDEWVDGQAGGQAGRWTDRQTDRICTNTQ